MLIKKKDAQSLLNLPKICTFYGLVIKLEINKKRRLWLKFALERISNCQAKRDFLILEFSKYVFRIFSFALRSVFLRRRLRKA